MIVLKHFQKILGKQLNRQVGKYSISFMQKKEKEVEIKEINILHTDMINMSSIMKQNESELVEALDDDPTNQQLKMKCAVATSLRRVLQNEIQDYLKFKQQIDTVKFNLLKIFSEKGYLLLENSGKPIMQLVKKFGSKQVEILFRANERHHVLKPDDMRHLYYNELEQTKDFLDIKFENQYFNSLHVEREKIAKDIMLDQENPLGSPLEEYSFTFLVVVKNQPEVEEYMVYECDEAYGEIVIQNVGLYHNYNEIEDIFKYRDFLEQKKNLQLMKQKQPIYKPNFLNLSEKLQGAFLEHMNSLDIDIDLIHNMHRASVFKQQNLYVEWLFSTHQIAVDME